MKLFSLISIWLCLLLPLSAMARDVTGDYRMPAELEGCRVISIPGEGVFDVSIRTVVCENSTVIASSYSQGKTTRSIPLLVQHKGINRLNPPVEASPSKEECEENLPRNKHCVSVWIPAE